MKGRQYNCNHQSIFPNIQLQQIQCILNLDKHSLLLIINMIIHKTVLVSNIKDRNEHFKQGNYSGKIHVFTNNNIDISIQEINTL